MFDLRLGLWTQLTQPWDTVVEQWRTIEELGFDAAAVTDHFMPKPGNEDGEIVEGWTTLAALAALTPRVRLAVIVTGNTYRHPVVVAKQAVTLDHISRGRLDLGIGAGWYEREHQAYGFPFPPPGGRVEMLRESVQIIRALMSGGHTTFNGRYYQLDNAPFNPLPVQPGGIPIVIAAQGNRMLRLVAEYADTWNLNHSPEMMRELGPILLRHCAAIERDPASIRWSAFTYHGILDYDPLASVDAFRRAVSEYTNAGASDIYVRMTPSAGNDRLRDIAALLPELREEYSERQNVSVSRARR